MKFIQTITFVLLFGGVTIAQNTGFVFSGGYGFGNLTKSIFDGVVDANNETALPDDQIDGSGLGPIFLKAEYIINEDWGVGLNLAHIGMSVRWTDDFNYDYEIGFSNTSALLRLNYYLTNSDVFQLYSGIGLGYRGFGGWRFSSTDPAFTPEDTRTAINLGFDLTGGFRVFVYQGLAIYAEAGLAKGLLQFGASYNL